jgi:hypothetical protein
MSRVLTVAAVVLSLIVLSVPAAHARPLDEASAGLRLDVSWLEAALSWLTGFIPTAEGPTPQRAIEAATFTTDTSTGMMQPMTGSCIDPQGGRCSGL